MDSPTWYRIDPRRVAHETIDGEVIMIHLQLGNYYSLDGPGADLWRCLVDGCSREQTLAFLGRRYEAAAALIAQTVDHLLARLAEEELLENGAEPGAGAPAGEEPVGERLPFATPDLQKYTDMQDFLLVDPIHEVDETGWPNPQQAA